MLPYKYGNSMAEKSGGGARKTLVTLRPRSTSKNRKTSTRRKQVVTTSTAAGSSDPLRQNATTCFPLFSSNLLTNRPPQSLSSKQLQATSKSKQSVLVNHASRSRLRGGQAQSPTPVEQVTSTSDIKSSNISLSSVSRLSLKSEVIHAAGHYGDMHMSEYTRSHTGSSASDTWSDYESGDVFPIKYLPDDCLLKIFSLLPSHDKGRCAQV